jgi:DNA-binding response OmpR family regulator
MERPAGGTLNSRPRPRLSRDNSPAWRVIELQQAKLKALEGLLEKSRQVVYQAATRKKAWTPEQRHQAKLMDARIRRALER